MRACFGRLCIFWQKKIDFLQKNYLQTEKSVLFSKKMKKLLREEESSAVPEPGNTGVRGSGFAGVATVGKVRR